MESADIGRLPSCGFVYLRQRSARDTISVVDNYLKNKSIKNPFIPGEGTVTFTQKLIKY